MKKFQIILGILVVLGGFFANVFAIEHCPNNNNLPTESCKEVEDLKMKCRSDPNNDCSPVGCNINVANHPWFNNLYFLHDNINSSYTISFEKFKKTYPGISDPSSAGGVRTIQRTINEIASLSTGVVGNCNFVCEDGRLGKNTLDMIGKCIPKCNDDNKCPSFDRNSNTFVCEEGQEIDDKGCCDDKENGDDEENDGDGECTIECGSGEKLMNENSSDCKCVCDPTAILKNGEKQCCGIRLNTNVPFIGNCIQFVDEGENVDGGENTTVVNPNTAFPLLVGGLSKILVTVILVISFLLIIVAGVMISTAGADTSNAGKGKDLILKVIVGIALLGMSGMILKIVNPNFFG